MLPRTGASGNALCGGAVSGNGAAPPQSAGAGGVQPMWADTGLRPPESTSPQGKAPRAPKICRKPSSGVDENSCFKPFSLWGRWFSCLSGRELRFRPEGLELATSKLLGRNLGDPHGRRRQISLRCPTRAPDACNPKGGKSGAARDCGPARGPQSSEFDENWRSRRWSSRGSRFWRPQAPLGQFGRLREDQTSGRPWPISITDIFGLAADPDKLYLCRRSTGGWPKTSLKSGAGSGGTSNRTGVSELTF